MTLGPIFTIGHSTHSLQEFLQLLRRTGVTAIADVRSVPYSRFQPQFNRPHLSRILKHNQIAYVYLGDELGARSEDPSCYHHGRVQYHKLASTPKFRSGILRLTQGKKSYCIALMCAEKEPLECHRTLLIGRELDALGWQVRHIHFDGTIESHREAMFRLLKMTRLPSAELFRSEAELIAEACAIQETRTAYAKSDDLKNRSTSKGPP